MALIQNALLGLQKPPTTALQPGQVGYGMPATTAPTGTNSLFPGLSAPPAGGVNSMQMPTPPAPVQMPQLDTTPDAGAKLSGSDRYDEEATNAVRSMFGLWNDEQFGQDTSALEQQLRNRGIRPGDPAYNTELQRLRETQGKLRQSSDLQAVLTGGQEAERFLNMDNTAETSNLNRQLGVASDTRAQTELRRDAQRYNNDQSAGYVGMGLDLLDKYSNGGLLGLGNKAVDAISGGVNKLTGGATTGLLSKGASLLGLGGAAPVTGAMGGIAGGSLSTLGGAAAANSALGAAAAEGMAAANAALGTTTAAAGGGGGLGTTIAGLMPGGPVGWAAAAVLAAGAAVYASQPDKSRFHDDLKFNPDGTVRLTKALDGPKGSGGISAQEVNEYYGPALNVFAQTGDVLKAMQAMPQPTNANQQFLADPKQMLQLFKGSGNPFRTIAMKKKFGEGPWSKGNKEIIPGMNTTRQGKPAGGG